MCIRDSDNGFSCGHHGFWGKGNGTFPLNMYDNSVKVPAIFRHPGRIGAGKTTDAMVSQYDVMPTLLEYLHLPRTEDERLPGRSFADVLEGKTDAAGERVVVFDEYGPTRMIRTPEWKYVHRYAFGPHELYDLTRDPLERNNLADDKHAQPVVAELSARMEQWFARYVEPLCDGLRFPVNGLGQLDPITPDKAPAKLFEPDPRRGRQD